MWKGAGRILIEGPETPQLVGSVGGNHGPALVPRIDELDADSGGSRGERSGELSGGVPDRVRDSRGRRETWAQGNVDVRIDRIGRLRRADRDRHLRGHEL